jgi:prolipoprotein diacylglyceryltransferase
MFWMLVGNLILIFCAAAIFNGPAPLAVSLADLAYWAVVAGIIGARYLDVRSLGGKTSDGQRPATMTDWKRYSGVLLAVTLVVWLLLHAAIQYRR